MRIIVIEDHDDLRDMTVEALVQLGHVVCGLARAELLDAEFPAFRPHLLILDLNLPGEDGISLARRYHRAYSGLGIIMVTARALEHEKVEGYDSGADIYLAKPASLDVISAAIAALSRRITLWASDVPQLDVDPSDIKANERARAIHRQLTGAAGKLPTQDDLARQYGCTYRQLNKEFEKEYGRGISAYIADHRLSQARKAITETDMPIKLVANRCGFAHVPAFTTAFRARFGVPPGALRKQKRNPAASQSEHMGVLSG